MAMSNNNVAVLQMLSGVAAAAAGNQNSTPISIDGQDDGGCCGFTPVTINRTFPICLNGRVSQFSWTQFCEEIDVALEPIASIRTSMRRLNLLRACLGIGLFVAFMIFTIPSGLNDYGGIIYMDTYMYVILAIPVLLIIPSVCYSAKLVSSFQEAVSEIQKICTRKSNEDPEITYSVGQGMNLGNFSMVRVTTMGLYPIAIYINTGETQGASTGTGNLTGNLTGGTGSTAQRLQELEGIKSLITNEEYEQKRQQILNAV